MKQDQIGLIAKDDVGRPAGGQMVLYCKTDKALYVMDEDGVEHRLTPVTTEGIPCFSVALNPAAQTVATVTGAVLNFTELKYDTTGDFDVVTKEFQPTVAGYYQFNVRVNKSAGNTCTITLINDGNTEGIISSNNNLSEINGSVLVRMNGTTDKVWVEIFNSGATSITIQPQTTLDGFFVRGL
jgi:hypothetical protein